MSATTETKPNRTRDTLGVLRPDRRSYRRSVLGVVTRSFVALRTNKLLAYSLIVTGVAIGLALRLAEVERQQPDEPRLKHVVTLPKTGITIREYYDATE
jgi:hypothetical protein